MRNTFFAVLAMAGCGRIGFDPAGDGSAIDGFQLQLGDQVLGVSGPDWGRAVARLPDGGYVIAGQLASAVTIGTTPVPNPGHAYGAIITFDRAGVVRWARSLGGSAFGTAAGVTADDAGNLYIAGTVFGDVDFGGGTVTSQADDGYVASLTPDGVYRWAHLIGGPVVGGARDAAFDVIVRDGHAIVAGAIAGTVDFGGGPTIASSATREAFVAAYDATSGNYEWAQRFGDIGTNEALGLGSGPGGFYAAGVFEGSPSFLGSAPLPNAGGFDAFVAALDLGGGLRWVRVFGGTGTDLSDGVTVNATGDVFAVGKFQATIDPGTPMTAAGMSDGIVVSYADDGTYRWSSALGVTGCGRLDKVHVLDNGDLVTVGSFTDAVVTDMGPVISSGGADGLVLGVTPDGRMSWARRFGGAMDDSAWGVAGGGLGTLLVTGLGNHAIDAGCTTPSTADEQDFYLGSF